MNKLVYANFERCIRCQGCEVACQREHDGQSNMHVVLVEDRFAVPLNCRHCNPAPCAAACPVEAISTDEEEVKLDPAKCTGCALCLLACPFGVIVFNELTHIATKCDLCAARRAIGHEPACALTCPSCALNYDTYVNYTANSLRRVTAAQRFANPE